MPVSLAAANRTAMRRRWRAVVACWSFPGAAVCVHEFAPAGTSPSFGSWALQGPASAGIWMTGTIAVVLWGILPVVLLIVGIGRVRFAVPGWRWPTAWIAAVMAGLSLDPLVIFALHSFSIPRWDWLALSSGFVLVGATMIGLLTGARVVAARRGSAGVHRAPLDEALN
jgi:hypothetical protein